MVSGLLSHWMVFGVVQPTRASRRQPLRWIGSRLAKGSWPWSKPAVGERMVLYDAVGAGSVISTSKSNNLTFRERGADWVWCDEAFGTRAKPRHCFHRMLDAYCSWTHELQAKIRLPLVRCLSPPEGHLIIPGGVERRSGIDAEVLDSRVRGNDGGGDFRGSALDSVSPCMWWVSFRNATLPNP